MDTPNTLRAEPRRPDDRSAQDGAEPRRPDAEPLTLAAAAELLDCSVDALRRRMKQSGVRGELVSAPHGGRLRMLTAAEVAALRSAPNGAEPIADPARNGAEPRGTAPNGAEPSDAGWRELVATLRGELDRARAELGTERVAHEQALHRAEEAERGRHTAEARVEALRAAWWQWYALATGRGLWDRVRGRLPDPPAELQADRLLAKPKE